ncbi:MAG: cyclase family protein [Myxococcales bacterium]|nr:cyclase family protein [Myxococcales bacterium]
MSDDEPLIDISPTISARMAVFPGDVAYRREVSLDVDRDDPLTLSAITTTVHIGAHADAPVHYARGACGIEQRPLSRYYGPCQVVRVEDRRPPDHRIDRAALSLAMPGGTPSAPRVLVATGSFPDPNIWTDDFLGLSTDAIDFLAESGVVLVGIDTPSIDPFDDRILESHQAVARHDLAVLEGLVLAHVNPGHYTLLALPLKLEGADASPVRAALIPG